MMEKISTTARVIIFKDIRQSVKTCRSQVHVIKKMMQILLNTKIILRLYTKIQSFTKILFQFYKLRADKICLETQS